MTRLFRWFRRHALGVAVLGVWLAVLGWHVRREYFKAESLVLLEGSRALAPGSYFYIVRMGGRAIGLATSRLDTVPEGFVFEDQITLDVPALDTLHRALVQTRVRLDRSLGLQGFAFNLVSEVGRFAVTGEAQPDSSIVLEIESGGGTETMTLRPEEGAVLPTVLPLRLAAGGRLQEGAEYRLRLFDPSVLATREAIVRVGERDTLMVPDSADLQDGQWVPAAYDTVPVWRLEEEFGGIVTETWVDDDGRVIKASSALGFTLERTEYELAQAEWDASRGDASFASGYGAIIESTAIASNVAVAGSDIEERLRVRLLEVDLQGFDLAGGRQSLRGDTLLIQREPATALTAAYRLPYRGGGEAAEELGSTPLIQSRDPRIVSIARGIADGERDPAIVARKLNEWVYRVIRKDITLSVPSAVQVLEQKQGDCNEHTVLYVALARALGLPARTAVGLVLLDGRFYYHAWPEVWLDGWVAVDPTLGQYPADAAHIRFIIGGLARQVELIRLIGQLRLDIV